MADAHAIYDESTGLYKHDGYYQVESVKELNDIGYDVLYVPNGNEFSDLMVLDPVMGRLINVATSNLWPSAFKSIQDVGKALNILGKALDILCPGDPESHRNRIFEASKWPQGQIVYKGFVQVEKLSAGTLGAPFPLEVVRVSNSVSFLVYNKTTDELLFTIQDRAPMMSHDNRNGTILEVGAGRFDLKIGAKGLVVKELFEELGVTATEDEVLLLNNGVPVALSPGVLTEKQYLAFVEVTDDRIDKSKKLYGNRDEGEKISRRFIPVSHILANSDFVPEISPAIARPVGELQIEDMKTWALVQWFLCNSEKIQWECTGKIDQGSN